ncbi:MAG: gliding motility-associated C-terminal domain-containing protein [Saprospiraceae bacterium]|nr:gliding motility-associated C-terminal domain-containing protein [Saprospiraceae bacterium]
MKIKAIWILVLTMYSAVLFSQEICDNGIDDDGDGLIDLQDDECICNGIFIGGDMTSLIPNPSFENYQYCPYTWGLNGLDDWIPGNDQGPDYYNTCGFVIPAIYDAGLIPFPDGEGIVSTHVSNGATNMIGVCLNDPFLPGINYTMSFETAFLTTSNLGNTCIAPPGTYQPIKLTLYGTPACSDLPVGVKTCPIYQGSSWVVLAEVLVDPVMAWHQFTWTFSPDFEIEAIMFGGPCNTPPGWNAWCEAVFLWDNFSLEGSGHITELDLFTSGDPCSTDFSLFASVEYNGNGQWQWYFEGIALPDQTNQDFYVSENAFQSGTYQVTYSTPEGCVQDSITVELPSNEITEVLTFFCPGGSVECAGETFYTSGSHEVVLQSALGCDSIVVCHVEEYLLSPATVISIDTCGPVSIEVCGNSFSETGLYNITCTDWRGCDSMIVLDLRIMEPEALVAPPPKLTCDSLQSVLLNGANSEQNPISGGLTSYSWTGPINGIEGDIDGPLATALIPGKYCLSITFEFNGVICRDSTCVIVTSSEALPDLPMIYGSTSGCYGDTLTFGIIHLGKTSITGYEWMVPSGIQVQFLDDSTMLYPLNEPGSTEFCARTYNDCGTSDTVCLQLTIGLPETSIFQHTTCDPAQAGTDTLWLQNQYGCDSLVITTTSLLPSHNINQTVYTCDPAQAGLDTLFLTNQYGCDSTLYIERIYSGNYQETNLTLICGAGANYADTLLVTTGPCDSLFITEYTYAPLDTTWFSSKTCDPALAGISVAIQPSALGCDSTIVTTTSLLPSDSTLLSGVTCDPAGVMHTVTVLPNQYGCDSVVTTEIKYVEIDTLYVAKTTCEPSQVGTIVSILPGADCDTVLVTETTYVPFTQSEETIILCGQTGILSDTTYLQNSAGCDSLAIRFYEYVSLISQFQIQGETCAGDQDGRIEIINISGGQSPFELQLNGSGWQSATDFDNLSPRQYTILIRDAAGCLDTLTGLVITPGATIAIDAGPDRIAAPGEVIDLSAQTTQSLSQVQWTASDPLSCPTCLQTALGPLTTNQTVVVTGWTLEGCSDSDALDVIIKTRGNIFIPNSFTPNNDGINDVFSIYGNDQINRIKNLAIFDRWGNALYARTDLPINDPSAGWDGTFRDEVMDPGVYIYVVEVELIDGTVRLYKGDVTLTR